MSNQYRANDHLFNKLFVAYAEIYKNNKRKYSINLREIVEDNRKELDAMVLEYCSYLSGKAYDDDSQSELEFNVPSGITIRNYSDSLYDHGTLPHLADEKCRFLLRAVYRSIYVDAEKKMRLSLVKDTIASIIHESRELRNIEYKYLRKWIDDLDNLYLLVDLSLLLSESEIERVREDLINRILPTDNITKRLQPIQFIIGSSETSAATNMQNEIIHFRNNLKLFYSDEMFICSVTNTSSFLLDYKNNSFNVSPDEKYIFILDNIVSNEDELVYQKIKHGTENGYPMLEIWVKGNGGFHGRQNNSGIRIIKDANEQGFIIKSYKDIEDILLDVFESLVRDDQCLAERDIRITNMRLYVDGKEMLFLEHSSPYNSAQAELLDKKISDLQLSMQNHYEEIKNINERIELYRSQLQGYRDNMDEILTMLICNRNSQDSNLSKYQSVSFWSGNSESARNELDNPQWERLLKRGRDSIEKGLHRIEEYMESRFLLIQIIQSQIIEDESGSNKDEILNLYEELEGLSLKYNVKYDMIFKYADYLYRITHYEECIIKSERLLKLCDVYEVNNVLSDSVCVLLGDAYKAIGKYSESLDYLDRVLNKNYDRSSKIWLRATVSKLGGLFLIYDMNAFGPVLDAVPKTVLKENYEDPDMIIIQARIYHDQGLYYSHNSEFNKAIKSYEHAIRLYKFLAKKYEKDSLKAAETAGRLTSSINNLSDLYMLPDNYNLKLAESGYKKALKIAEQYSAPHMFPRQFESKKTIYMLKLAKIMKERKEFDLAIKQITDVITIRTSLAEQSNKYRRGLIFALISRANVYMDINELNLARLDLEAAECILNDKDTDDSSALLEVRCSYNSAWAVWKLMKNDKAIKKQFDLAIKSWDEFAAWDPIYANRKKEQFIDRYKMIQESQKT